MTGRSIPSGLRRRVLVLDPVARTREHTRRAVRALGHTPLVFESLEELLQVQGTSQRCSLMCLGLPSASRDLRWWIQRARSIVGRTVPVLFMTRESLLKALQALGCEEGDSVLAAPASFAEIFNGLQEFVAHHGIATEASTLTWGSYAFVPALESVRVDGAEVSLRPLEFELALEFFHNVDRVLSRDWLRAAASGLTADCAGRSLDASVARLRTQLGLASLHGGEWRLSNVRYAGYRLSRILDKKPSKTPSPAKHHLPHLSESLP